MSVQIRLDIPALRHVIEFDPEFHLDLKKAVTSELVRKSILHQADAEIRSEISKATTAARSDIARQLREDGYLRDIVAASTAKLLEAARGGSSAVRLSDIDMDRVRASADTLVRQALDGALNEKMEQVESLAEDRIQNAINRLERRIEARLADLENDWRQEAVRQIKADVLSALQTAVN